MYMVQIKVQLGIIKKKKDLVFYVNGLDHDLSPSPTSRRNYPIVILVLLHHCIFCVVVYQ